jgi:hypothetical protein
VDFMACTLTSFDFAGDRWMRWPWASEGSSEVVLWSSWPVARGF